MTKKGSGPIAWMVHNRVTPNLLMIFLMLGGLLTSLRIKQEVFPEFELDWVTVRVAYPGASPEEVEQGVILAVEEAVRAVDGVKEVRSVAGEGSGTVTIELEEGADRQKAHQEIQQEVNRIRTFPGESERPQIALAGRRREVLDIQIYGDASEWALRDLAEQVRDRLLQTGQVTQIDLESARNYQVEIEVPQEKLRAYGLTLDGIADTIAAASVELPGGEIKTPGGEILLRFRDRKDWAREFARIPIVTFPDGTIVRLDDIAVVRDAFEETDREATFNGTRSIGLEVYRVGKETPIGVSDAVHEELDEILPDLPPGVHLTVNRDRSEIYRQRLTLLLKNAFLGLALVLLLLGLFLEFKLAFWVTMGIPISFLGAMLFLPGLDVTINMISMFAFIVALGIVVDDAIVAGENIYEYRQRGIPFAQAAVRGAREVAMPVGFSILTNIIAFLPLMFVPGMMGKFWGVIPVVVGTVFLVSWIEALWILPSHLAHTSSRPTSRVTTGLHRFQQRFSRFFIRCVETFYGPVLYRAVRFRYLTTSIALFVLLFFVGYAVSGRMGFVLMPEVESDRAGVTARLPYGSPLDSARAAADALVRGAQRVVAAHGGKRLAEGIFAEIDEDRVDVTVYLTPPEVRPMGTARFTELWREETGAIAGLQSLRYDSSRGGPGGGAGMTVELSHRDVAVLERASRALAEELEAFPVAKDIDDGYAIGKPQYDFVLTEAGRSLGLSSTEVARQVRDAFHGAEALRQQRGRNEVKVVVRLPRTERSSESDVEELLIRTPAGRDVPLRQIAEVRRGRAYTAIDRRDGRRTVTVSANITPPSETNRVLATLTEEVLPSLMRDFPGLASSFEGRQAHMREALSGLKTGFLFVLGGIYFLLAIPFRSYVQPLVVMFAIPFGVVGAILGHMLMGYNLSIISLFGVIALCGVVVNDSLLLVDYANRRRREEGAGAIDAVTQAGIRRFRPVLLTTLTTFGGLSPMIFETSRQARFMIPMAISLGYGILFATAITLFIVPALYAIVEDLTRAVRWVVTPPGPEPLADAGRNA